MRSAFMAEYILEANNITKKFPGVIANDNVTLKIRNNEIHGLIGENGAGKSTLLRILNGWYPYGTFEGELKINGEKVEFHSPYDAHIKGIGFVPQEINVLNNLSVAENIFVGNWSLGSKKKAFVDFKNMFSLADDLLRTNNICLDSRVNAGVLSVGQKQLLMLARALSRDPKVLILDEPTSSLTLDEVDNLVDIINRLKARGTSIIFVTHKLEEIIEITDRVTVLRDGRNISCMEKKDYDRDRIISEMVGRNITNIYPKREVKIGEEILSVENLTVEHPKILNRNIIENVSFNLRKGEVLGLAGLIGAGRTEVLNALFGVYGRKSGKIVKNGKIVQISNVREAIKNGFSLVTEDRKRCGLLFQADIKRNITLNTLEKIAKFRIINNSIESERANTYFRQMRIKAPSLETNVFSLSGGNQQKVVMGRALNAEPEIILLDEPTKGIDVGSKNDIYNLINELVEQGKSIIMVSSELPELLGMCDRFIVMAEGRIVDELTRDEASDKRIMEAATRMHNRKNKGCLV
jgi:ABC-type sugar transport system ATPase subunit